MDEYEEVQLVREALIRLNLTDDRWSSNHRMFVYRYDDRERIIWWRRAKVQANKGVPAMQELLLKVLELRLMK